MSVLKMGMAGILTVAWAVFWPARAPRPGHQEGQRR